MKTCPLPNCRMEICPKCKGHHLPDMNFHPDDDLAISAVGERLYLILEYHPGGRAETCKCGEKK